MHWFWFICLTGAAVSDIKKRSVSDRLLLVCGILGMISGWQNGMSAHWMGILAGVALLIISRLTEGAIGSGDGWFVIASAGYLNTEEMWILLLGSFGVSWFLSMGMMMYRVWTGGGIYEDTLPFLACMWPVGIWILALRGW